MIQFHETRYGQRFFEHDLPELVSSIQKIHRDYQILMEMKAEELRIRQKEMALKEQELYLKEEELKWMKAKLNNPMDRSSK